MKGVLTGHPSRRLSGRTVLGMNPSYDFTGQVALVTGASSGMGLATAQAFADAGAAVVLADVNEAALGAAADALTARPPSTRRSL